MNDNHIFYRVINPQYEKSGFYSFTDNISPVKKRFWEIAPLLRLIAILSKHSDIQISSAIRLGVNYDWCIEIINNHIRSFSESIPLIEIGITDKKKKSIDMSFLYNFADNYNQIVDKGNQICLNDYHLIWEYIWEIARQEICPFLPSRLESIMLWENEEEAKTFLEKERNQFDYKIVRVCVTNPKIAFSFDSSWLDDVPTESTYNEAFEYALNYWNKKTTAHPVMEVLYNGAYSIHDN